MEREVKDADAETRRARREADAVPVLTRFRHWLDGQADVVLPKSPIGEAVGYARAQWTALTRYCEDGALAIDNNVSERALRKVVTGRANWTFCGSDAGGGAPRSSTASWRRARRIASTPGPICATCSSAFPPTPIAAAPSCSRATGRPPHPATPP